MLKITMIKLSSFILAWLCFLETVNSSPAQHSRRSAAVTDIDNDQVAEVLSRVPRYEEVESQAGCHSNNLKLVKLAGSEAATCNDGTVAGYYILKRSESRRWVIYLQGGWYCADEFNCRTRKENYGTFYSSSNWQNCYAGNGIISTDENENPHLSSANMVYIPYCSSDVWSGTSKNRRLGELTVSFMGSTIIEQVVQRLIHNHGMQVASTILLAGSSAGATGVFMNIDRVQNILDVAESDAELRGVVDSGWYLYRQQMESDVVCRDQDRCSPIDSIKKGVFIWKPNIPESCLAKYTPTAPVRTSRRHRSRDRFLSRNYQEHDYRMRPRDHTWKCYFGQLVYSHIETPVYIVQWMYDEVQLMSDNIFLFGQDNTADLLRYFHHLHAEMSQTFNKINGIFAPSCIAHTTLERSWTDLEVDGINLADALQCWMQSTITPQTKRINKLALKNEKSAEIENDRRIKNESDISLVATEEDSFNGVKTTDPEQSCKYNVISNCSLPQCHSTCPAVDGRFHRRPLNAIEFIENILQIDIRSIAFYYFDNSDPMETWRMLQEPAYRNWLVSLISKHSHN